MVKLLTIGNPKTLKGEALGVHTAILHLLPAFLSGKNLCASSTAGCRAACLHTAGNPMYMANKLKARADRSAFFLSDRAGFIKALEKELAAHVRKSKRLGLIPMVRLNGTTDIMWEKIAPQLFTSFPALQFYDYSKHSKLRTLPTNYHITYSYSERDANTPDRNSARVATFLKAGVNVAVVFKSLPSTFLGHPVVSGDDSDVRPYDPRGVIVGLKAKGKARKDKTGFVQ